ncbi:MAG: formate dehydrogenase beta subunit [Rhodospirillaceae bacterium]
MTVTLFIPGDSAALSVGSDAVAIAIQEEARKRDAEITIVRNGSRGLLWLEPLVEVETENGRIGYGPITPSDVAGLFEAGFLAGTTHPLGHGKVDAIPYLANQERLTFVRCGVIDPLNLSAYEGHGGLVGLRKAISLEPIEVIEMIKKSGLRGRGGAGFPTGIKWDTVFRVKADQKYICCNADEGDSGTFADRMLMEGDPFSLLEGMVIAGHSVGADTGYIYIRSEYPHAIKRMQDAIAIWEDASLLGEDVAGSGMAFRIHIRVGAGAYICGEESSMLESLEGKRGQIRAKPPIPAISGLFGKPTVVNNVLSLATIPFILSYGGEAYAAYGDGRSLGTQPFQLGGDVARGGLVEKSLGVTLRELIEDFGGGTRSGRSVRAALVGGPLGAYLPENEFDVNMNYEALMDIGGMLGHGGIVVFNDSVDMAHQARFAMKFCEIESCGKCTPCRIGSVRGKEVLDKIIAGEKVEENLHLLEELCNLMTDASLCAMGGLTPVPVRSALKHFPEDFLSTH